MRWLVLLLLVLGCITPAFANPQQALFLAAIKNVTLPPNAPTSVTATGGPLHVMLTWSAGAVDGSHSAATQYDVYKGTSSGGETLLASNVTSPYDATGLTAGTTYYFKVKAINSVGEALSSEVSAVPTSDYFASTTEGWAVSVWPGGDEPNASSDVLIETATGTGASGNALVARGYPSWYTPDALYYYDVGWIRKTGVNLATGSISFSYKLYGDNPGIIWINVNSSPIIYPTVISDGNWHSVTVDVSAYKTSNSTVDIFFVGDGNGYDTITRPSVEAWIDSIEIQ